MGRLGHCFSCTYVIQDFPMIEIDAVGLVVNLIVGLLWWWAGVFFAHGLSLTVRRLCKGKKRD